MFAISPDQSLLWLAIRQGWGRTVRSDAAGGLLGASVAVQFPGRHVTALAPPSHRLAIDG